jgi:hypothetical protein
MNSPPFQTVSIPEIGWQISNPETTAGAAPVAQFVQRVRTNR